MHIDPLLPTLAAITMIALIMNVALKRLNQPYIIAYLLAGIVLGPFGLGVVQNDDAIVKLGAIGVVILMFFIGIWRFHPHAWSNIGRLPF